MPLILLKAVVPVTSLSPCSKEISRYGAHNQRSHVSVSARVAEDVFVVEFITLVDEEASCEIFGLVIRPDEKYITERVYEIPKFVEDMVRDFASRLNADASILAYTVECENFESIHTHSSYAQIIVYNHRSSSFYFPSHYLAFHLHSPTPKAL